MVILIFEEAFFLNEENPPKTLFLLTKETDIYGNKRISHYC